MQNTWQKGNVALVGLGTQKGSSALFRLSSGALNTFHLLTTMLVEIIIIWSKENISVTKYLEVIGPKG